MIKITKALIIDEPWISRIINGEKDWEMRSFSSRIRGPVGLIRKGSLQVVGIANLSNVSGPYDNDALIANTYHHTIPSEMFDDPAYKWRFAWELTEAKPLPEPVRYVHKNGAVIWVDLDEQAVANIALQLNGDHSDAYIVKASSDDFEPVSAIRQKTARSKKSVQMESQHAQLTSVVEPSTFVQLENSGLTLVPKAKDGSVFSVETCNNKGIYTVGSKGEEKKFRNFDEALAFLKAMPTARWRRKNINGTPGIVTAVDWVAL
tara:strand:+ start:16096 stop:16881 length:786 start_codon:yes stop_codon:yes gene_type:complete